MKKEKLIDAITDIEPDVLDRYFDMKKGFSERKKPHKHGWIKWVVIAACLSLLVTTVFAATAEFLPFEKPDDNKGTELSADDALVVALVEYMNELEVDHDMPAITTADKMDAIRDGQQALHVAFDSSKPYFVCAYSAGGQKSGEYVWIKYADASEITEQCSYLQMALAFQVNPSLFVKDIMTEDAAVPTMEHFQPYEPQFNKGVNTKATDTFDETFIYLNSSEGDALYHSTTAYDHEWVTVPCRYFGDEYYVARIIGNSSDEIKGMYEFEDLGDYFDGMGSRTDPHYHETIENEDGTTTYLSMVKVGWFADIVKSAIVDAELKNLFEFMKEEEETIEKVNFHIENQSSHYFDSKLDKNELDDSWVNPKITIRIHCDYTLATEEEWYKACDSTNIVLLQNAFYDEYCSDLLAERPYIDGSSHYYGFVIIYSHADENCTEGRPLSEVLPDVYHDYEIIKKLAELEYVTLIEVGYWYSVYEGEVY